MFFETSKQFKSLDEKEVIEVSRFCKMAKNVSTNPMSFMTFATNNASRNKQ